ncbi:rod shape-determining protein RodA [Tenacibaculum finnmarkense genomovar finnmarkense]|uniref:rod shape-determining protein RodA n=1 Tax=Tenacibaculum finnmarkense TaxID=2781243 RepID=UPI001E4F6FDC|nr:rod shape-determining protein RodA [Tenacibaculum finnmarkense]MCD8416237.1 rod shape-determining protein RodA [Tenacibaculum finnmarkense genomovar finnmarkense]MCD8453210.1 rod shape-determining protein RodA [Tenacibaculum finnmarkense genomovar ulcerans]MCG8184897.1 rod shape-determining protein RodA [Tenacibaculum finnmarkense genomovar finnmarkense]MCG8201269.1 rod shape-determining protein RodA [Tenacibaculum finnmarkense genomovar finnmarkense]MCG8208856.1 rod shape-determining prote
MRQERNNIFENIDWLLILLYVVLVGFGWMNIYASSSTDTTRQFFDFSTKYGKQFIFIGLSIPLIILILFFNSKFYERFASILYVLSLVLLAGVFIFGKKINGATSWYNFGGIGLQPSEFSKAFTALALAKLISDRKYNFKLLKNQLKAFLLIFLPAILIAFQPDMGSVLIYFSFFFVLNREGLTLNYIVFGTVSIILFILTIYFGANWILFSCLLLISSGLARGFYKDKRFLRFNAIKIISLYLFTTLFIYGIGYTYENVLEPHQKDRFDILLGKTTDLKNKGYNTYQSKLTISSGGLVGKGFLQGDRTQGKFVPEQETDYIYSTVGEEWGFLGSSTVIIVFMLLLYRIIYLAENQTNKFGRVYGYGIASIIFFHIVVNIGMVIGLLPTIGIPLPFFSYGGSSLWGFTVLLFIFIRLDAHKKYDF